MVRYSGPTMVPLITGYATAFPSSGGGRVSVDIWNGVSIVFAREPEDVTTSVTANVRAREVDDPVFTYQSSLKPLDLLERMKWRLNRSVTLHPLARDPSPALADIPGAFTEEFPEYGPPITAPEGDHFCFQCDATWPGPHGEFCPRCGWMAGDAVYRVGGEDGE